MRSERPGQGAGPAPEPAGKGTARTDGIVLSVRNITKTYKGLPPVLRGLSFHLRRGECVGIIGRNGAGKSTLLKIIAGVTAPDSGSVRLSGRTGGILELGAAFYPAYTGRENIRLAGTLMGLSPGEIRRITPSVIAFSGLGDRIDAPVRTYSSGMFVRLAFSVAVCATPDILIIDEALVVGDIEFQKQCYEKIREMSAASTVLMVSHDLHAITRFCTRILVLEEGQIVCDGPARQAVEVYTRILQGEGPALPRPPRGTGETMHVPPADCVSGEGRIRITGCTLSVDGLEDCEVCREGQTVRITLETEADLSTEDLIVGYQIRDRCGTEIFGETQLGRGDLCPADRRLGTGRSVITFTFRWPRVREGLYFITPGIGIGPEVMRQREQCWLNDVFRLRAIVEEGTVYGMFNVSMEEFRIRPAG